MPGISLSPELISEIRIQRDTLVQLKHMQTSLTCSTQNTVVVARKRGDVSAGPAYGALLVRISVHVVRGVRGCHIRCVCQLSF